MDVSRDGHLQILRFEGIVTVAYVDGRDKLTGAPKYSIGVGLSGAKENDTTTIPEALSNFKKGVAERAAIVSRMLGATSVTQYQFDALVCLYFQGGRNKITPVLLLLKAGYVRLAAALFEHMGTNEHDEPLEGLKKRRLLEQQLFRDGKYREDRFEIPLFRANPRDPSTTRETYNVTSEDFA